ncbi:hypothetical protein ACCO45_008103 [Purpureocillium lilacinum]|uniref:Uncharacterized protein n=1 Tax=Purpureocillium lilacinum TaxID=33203 RepID=A0ACC4DMB4_PURLI
MLERSRAKMSGEHPTFAIPELRAYRCSSSDTDELDSSEAVDMPEMPVVEAHNSPIALKEIPNDEKLTGVENYEVWKATMTLNLQVLGLKEHYDGTVRRPAPGHPDEGKFDDDQAKTLCYIWGGLSLQMRADACALRLDSQIHAPADLVRHLQGGLCARHGSNSSHPRRGKRPRCQASASLRGGELLPPRQAGKASGCYFNAAGHHQGAYRGTSPHLYETVTDIEDYILVGESQIYVPTMEDYM